MHDYIIPFGPQHPALKESMCLRVDLDGNYIRSAHMRLGYMHKGIEKLLEGKNVDQGLYIVQRVCGICSFAYELAYLRAIEKMLKGELNEKVRLLRTIVAELERMHSHMLWAGIMAHEAGYESMFMLFWRSRELVLDLLEKLTGGRVHHNYSKILSVRYDLTSNAEFFDNLDKIENSMRRYAREFEKNRVIRKRTEGVGVITKNDAKGFGLVGPIARASGIKSDIRKLDPYAAYDEINFNEVLMSGGDAYARTLVRLNEIFESIKIIRAALEILPDKEIPKAALCPPITAGQEYGRVEAPRGELFHFITVKNGKIVRARLRPPTFVCIQILDKLLIGKEVGDVPIIIASLDPCFSCLERVMIVRDGKKEYLVEEEFRRKYLC